MKIEPKVFLAALCLLLLPVPAQAQLAPYKDDYFAYPGILKTADNEDYLVVDYSEMRDINGRDATPEKRVKDAYVSLTPRRSQKDLTIKTQAGPVKALAVGKIAGNASVIVIYLHGQGGNRLQGMNDYTFGGNFNRLKNLMARNGGLYLSPDFSDFADKGEAEIAGLIAQAKASSPRAPIIVACGSAGGALCWRMASDPAVARDLSGLILLGSLWDDAFLSSPAFKRRVPVFFGHGSRDPVFPVEKQEAFYRGIRKAAPGYPVRFHRFETGNHGTPIRMTDWRGAINWILGAQPK
ncbi:alpha/beta hydrolase [Phyllobacterium salinisoli]|uniref:Alpha/beta hydrolase n=1 Tax=Phyllobacterium salinisoli TaxID=1899321 RepID=A0A368K7N6_9HYPH|nr:alpha/beta hydrolase [Phyllobacterium salinisoli]RCS24392.1 alpha/beta hydrolase [Phyllobacterium salinisoli]